jgi:ankyrin repeat protein
VIRIFKIQKNFSIKLDLQKFLKKNFNFLFNPKKFKQMKSTRPAKPTYEERKQAFYAAATKDELILEKDPEMGTLLLHDACEQCDFATVENILTHESAKQVLDAIDNQGRTPLYYACKSTKGEEEDRLRLAKFLMDNGADPYHLVYSGWRRLVTPLSAAEERNPNIADLIKRRNAAESKSESKQEIEATSPAAAIDLKQEDKAATATPPAIAKPVSKKKKKEKKGEGKIDEDEKAMADAIAANKARAEAKAEEKTPEQQAIDCAQKIIKDLKLKFPRSKRGVFRINDADVKGDTVLHHACRMDSAVDLEDLLKHPQIDLNLKDQTKRTPLLLACAFGKHNAANALLDDERTNPLALDKDNLSALHYLAARRDDKASDVAKRIIGRAVLSPDRGIDFLNTRGPTGSAVHACCTPQGNSEILEMLLNAGADKEAPLSGRSPLQMAKFFRNQESLKVLRDRAHGARPQASPHNIGAANVVEESNKKQGQSR